MGTKMARFFGEGKKKKLFIGQVTKVVGKNYHVLYEDGDEDDYGDPEALLYACAQPEGYVENMNDCNDQSHNSEFIWN